MRELPFSSYFDQASVGKLLEMMGKRRRRDGEIAENVAADELRGVGNFRKDLISAGIGQGFRYSMKLFALHDLCLGVPLPRVLDVKGHS